MRAPSRELGEGVFDFQHFHVERLRQDLARLNLEHRTLIAASRGTLASQGRVHKAVLAMLAAGSFEQLLQTMTTDLAVLLDVDIVTIGVESAAAPAGPAQRARHPAAEGRRRSTRCSAPSARCCCAPTSRAKRRCLAGRPVWCARRLCCASALAGRPARPVVHRHPPARAFSPGARHRAAELSGARDQHHDLAMADPAGVMLPVFASPP